MNFSKIPFWSKLSNINKAFCLFLAKLLFNFLLFLLNVAEPQVFSSTNNPFWDLIISFATIAFGTLLLYFMFYYTKKAYEQDNNKNVKYYILFLALHTTASMIKLSSSKVAIFNPLTILITIGIIYLGWTNGSKEISPSDFAIVSIGSTMMFLVVSMHIMTPPTYETYAECISLENEKKCDDWMHESCIAVQGTNEDYCSYFVECIREYGENKCTKLFFVQDEKDSRVQYVEMTEYQRCIVREGITKCDADLYSKCTVDKYANCTENKYVDCLKRDKETACKNYLECIKNEMSESVCDVKLYADV